MTKSWIAPAAALILALAPAAQGQTKKDGAGTSAAFIEQALKSGENEVAIAKLAAEKSQSADIKELAQMLVSDHTAVNEQLALLHKDGAPAQPKSGRPSDSPDKTDRGMPPVGVSPGAGASSPELRQLSGLSGAGFDKQFLGIIILGHEKSVALYENEAQSGTNPASKKLATETLPKIKQHLQQAKSLQAQTKTN